MRFDDARHDGLARQVDPRGPVRCLHITVSADGQWPPTCTTNAESSMGGASSPVISRAPSNTVALPPAAGAGWLAERHRLRRTA